MSNCQQCGEPIEIGDWPYCPHGSTVGRFAQGFEPVIVHRDADGNVRLPANRNAPVPEGFERVELTNVNQVRQLEGKMNADSKRQWEQWKERESEHFSELQREGRRELRERMKHMSPMGRMFAEYAMARNDRRSQPGYEPNFFVEVFSMDASNREAWRDAETGWRARKV